ncbi:MAG: hypothetical protein AAF944_04755 [Bacteroidota bacterium]
MENQSRSELRYGGLLLSLGALTTVICILLEVNAGWASLLVEMQRTDYEAGSFLFENWSEMNLIWTWSLIGNVFFTIASILLMKDSIKIGWFPASLFWSIFFIGSLLLILSFGISLGSYYSALSVIDDHPYVFETIRGIALYLFNYGALFQLVVLVIYFHQGFSNQGIVSRLSAIIILLLLVGSFALMLFGVVSFGVFAIACFLAPLLLGIFYMREMVTEAG